MVHDESHLISWHGSRIPYLIGMFLLEMLSEHCMCT